jgi:PKD repeat protein
MTLFIYKINNGLAVSFNIIGTIPANSSISWDFGDLTETSTVLSPTHNYKNSGFYTVKLTITKEDSTIEKNTQLIVLPNEGIQTHLSDSIFNLIDSYIPADFVGMNYNKKVQFISKWQLYIAPLVNHTIEINNYQDELAFEGLENQLILELSAYDYIYIQVTSLINKIGNFIGSVADNYKTPNENEGGNLKSITTGPTQVQYYDKISDSMSAWYKSYIQAMGKDGILDHLKVNLCMLAKRLDIYLPICNTHVETLLPEVGDRRIPLPLDGPDPLVVINK